MTYAIQDHPLIYFDLQSYKTELKTMQSDLECLKVETQKRSIVLEKILFNKGQAKNSVCHINPIELTHISTFPHDILLEIFLQIDFKDAFNVITTCKKWSAFSNDPIFIRNLIKIKRPDTFELGRGLNLNAWVVYGKIPFVADKLSKDICKLREGYQRDIEKRQETITFVALSTLAPFIGYYVTSPIMRKIVMFIKSLI